ncbi:MAG: hypothetical protein KDB53_05425 [Planctomycetes bacterium]|nr:hypothetical protein [Planctomycetota bacterium]
MSKKAFRRRQLIVDRSFQVSIAVTLVSVLLGFSVLFALVVFFVPERHAFEMVTGDQVRNLLLGVNGIYFFVVAMALTVVSVIVTHRVAGPAWVLKNALDGFAEGEYGRRTAVRKKDYLRDLSASTTRLATQLKRQEDRRQALLLEIEALLERGDLESALELVRRNRVAASRPRRVHVEA